MKKIILYMLITFNILGMINSTCNAEERGQPVAGTETIEFVQDSFAAATAGVEVTFPYIENQIYQIYLQEGYITDIRFEKGEQIKYVGGGDTTRWIIDKATVGNGPQSTQHLYVKPVQKGIYTNLIINTDRRSYQLNLVSTSYYNPALSWLVPKNQTQLDNEKKIRDYGTINADKLDFSYNFTNKKLPWAPERIFSDGKKTYIQLKPSSSAYDIPAFFVVNDEGTLVYVNYRIVNGYYVIDRLFDKGVLIVGKEKIKIKRMR